MPLHLTWHGAEALVATAWAPRGRAGQGVNSGATDRGRMELTPDELAGIVDGFGGLARSELSAAVIDLAARSGDDHDPDELSRAIDEAIDAYFLLDVDADVVSATGATPPDGTLLVPGPAALPTLPAGGEDLPHLLDIDGRSVDREAVAKHVEGRLRTDAAAVIDAGDAHRAEQLLDACYEVEAWGPVDLADAREELAALVE